MLSYIKEKSSMTGAQIANVRNQLQKISSLINTLSTTQNNVEIIGTLVESELQSMDKAIEETVAKIQVLNDKNTCKTEKRKDKPFNEVPFDLLLIGYVG